MTEIGVMVRVRVIMHLLLAGNYTWRGRGYALKRVPSSYMRRSDITRFIENCTTLSVLSLCSASVLQQEDAKIDKSAKLHAGNVFVTCVTLTLAF